MTARELHELVSPFPNAIEMVELHFEPRDHPHWVYRGEYIQDDTVELIFEAVFAREIENWNGIRWDDTICVIKLDSRNWGIRCTGASGDSHPSRLAALVAAYTKTAARAAGGGE